MSKNVIAIVVALVSVCFSTAVCQTVASCHDIVIPMMNYDESLYNQYPQEKIDYYCAMSRAAFFETDEVAEGAPVYDISMLKTRNGEDVSQDFVVDLNTLSYYAYSFDIFRYQHYDDTVYFRTPNSAHQYLAVRSFLASLRIVTGEADMY